MKPRLLLVKPPEEGELNFGAFSLGVLAAAVADQAEVSIFDATTLPLGDAVDEVWRREADLVGVTAMGTSSVEPVAEFVQRLRSAGEGRGTPIIAGGQGATWGYADLLSSGVDTVVLGEGELTLRRILAEGLHPGAPGTASLTNGKAIVGPRQRLIEDLDSLPMPARAAMGAPPDEMHLIETSRGCPHACSFCATTRFHGRRWRAKSAERVVAEVRELIDDHGAWIVHFADDNTTADPHRVRRICELLARNPLPLFFVVSARADDLLRDPDLLPSMAAARMMRVSVGVETLDHSMASRVGKPIASETFREAFRRMRELGIFSVASLIVGLPGEDPASREGMVESALEAGPDSALFLPFLPIPHHPNGSVGSGFDPDPAVVREADRLTREFALHPVTRARLEAAAAETGVRGLLAAATLEKQASMYEL